MLFQQTSRVVYPELLQIVPDGAKFCPHDFDHPQPSIWLNSCLGHTFSTAHASIFNMAGQEILIYCVFLWNAGCVYQCSIWNSLSSWLVYCSGKMFSKVWELRILFPELNHPRISHIHVPCLLLPLSGSCSGIKRWISKFMHKVYKALN